MRAGAGNVVARGAVVRRQEVVVVVMGGLASGADGVVVVLCLDWNGGSMRSSSSISGVGVQAC